MYHRLLLLSFIVVFSHSMDAISQPTWCFNYWQSFDDGQCLDQLFIDTINNPFNIWEINTPNKNNFNNGHSAPNSIITSSSLFYPTNDTSRFVVINPVSRGFIEYNTAYLHGYYKVQSDSNNDFGRIEFSPDNGITWIDLIEDTVYTEYYNWTTSKPLLTGSNDWTEFHVNLTGFGEIFNYQEGDSVHFRFSFLSDSIQDSLAGLMFDDLNFTDLAWGIKERPFFT